VRREKIRRNVSKRGRENDLRQKGGGRGGEHSPTELKVDEFEENKFTLPGFGRRQGENMQGNGPSVRKKGKLMGPRGRGEKAKNGTSQRPFPALKKPFKWGGQTTKQGRGQKTHPDRKKRRGKRKEKKRGMGSKRRGAPKHLESASKSCRPFLREYPRPANNPPKRPYESAERQEEKEAWKKRDKKKIKRPPSPKSHFSATHLELNEPGGESWQEVKGVADEKRPGSRSKNRQAFFENYKTI